MYIESIRIKNFRSFLDFSMEFQKGLNVIVGANNSGKTGLLQAVCLLSSQSKKMTAHDFNKNNLKKFNELYRDVAPKIEVEYVITHTVKDENSSDESILRMLPFLDTGDLTNTSSGLTEYTLHARVRAVYALKAEHDGDYRDLVAAARDLDEYTLKLNRFIQDGYFEWTYTNSATGGTVEAAQVSGLFDIQYIRADRSYSDVRDEVRKEIDSFTDRPEIVSKIDKLWFESAKQLKDILGTSLTNLSDLFRNEANEIGLSSGRVAIATDIQIANQSVSSSYVVQARDTNAEFNLPLDHNGLGYNNLINIYMLIKLNEMGNDQSFRILCLEEPEAHLHPAMQYKLFKYLKTRDEDSGLSHQIFVTTHSSNISAVAGLDNMYMMALSREGLSPDCVQQSLRKQFENTDANSDKEISKRHLTKFLDVTRSDMLFADKVILVEGIAERLLLPRFMEMCGIPHEDHHISIVEIGGKHFEHFVELFNGNAVKKKVLCITDCDFEWIEKTEGPSAFESVESYRDYVPNHKAKLQSRFAIDNLKIVSQEEWGRTFEDELFMANANKPELLKQLLKIVLPETLTTKVDEYGLNVEKWQDGQDEIDGRSLNVVRKYLDAYRNRKDTDEARKDRYANLMFAEMFLHYAAPQKGALALRLLVDYIQDGDSALAVPEYMRKGLEWLKQ